MLEGAAILMPDDRPRCNKNKKEVNEKLSKISSIQYYAFNGDELQEWKNITVPEFKAYIAVVIVC